MHFLGKIFSTETSHVLFSTGLFLVSVAIIGLVYRLLIKQLKKRAAKTASTIDDFVIDLLKVPLLWLSFWILFKVFSSYSFLSKMPFYNSLSQVNTILVILSTGWILIKIIKIIFYYLQNKLDINVTDNLNARKHLTKMKIFEGILVTIITVIIVAICLMTFDKVKAVGISLLTSAGIAGIIIGFAAQKSIAAFIAGIQIAITQPIRLDDVVIVEGEWGRIEEITLTFVVVKIWDERRLVLPVNYFLEKPFENWTHNTSTLLGTVFLYVDYKFPVDALRKHLMVLLENNPLWDKRVANIQVTDTKERYKELRVLISTADASIGWDLRVELREKLIDYINDKHPDCFVKLRLEN